jgi:polar amino acid transport system substrate-binding protein
MFPDWHKCLLPACVIVAGLFAWPVTGFASDDVTIMTEDYPPLNYLEGGELQGPSVDIVNAIRERLGIRDAIKVYPWARGYNTVETVPNTMLFSMTRSATREELFKWVGPLAEKKIGLFARRDRGIKLENLEQAKPYLIGVQLDGHGMEYLSSRGFENFDPSTTPLANMKKILAGRDDLWFASNATVAGNARIMDVDVDELELVLTVDNTFMYIAFNKQTGDHIVDQWQQAFDALVAEGVVKSIFEKHGFESLYPSF